ncbi:MAG: proline--tRNA ligase [Planctomycetota bacterium]|jgi:prolyl-tRNA synthetase
MSDRITPRSEDFPRWYQEVCQTGDLAENAPVRGCMVIKPHGYALWENIQAPLDRMFKETGHVNAYFPLFIPMSFLDREAKHVEGFSPELAVVTHGGGKELEEPLVVRPTSETVVGAMYAKWVQSHRDLPVLINQWANVVRWELRPRLFLRTVEFLWQEGHTVHATQEEAEEETLKILDIYERLATEYLAVPVHRGLKSRLETFAGADRTYAIEGLMQDGKALQMGTSHNLGQNFARAFDIQFQDVDGERKYGWMTSWGVSTRLIGGVVMAHGDDKGLVLPPRIAPVQVVLVPIYKKVDDKAAVLQAAARMIDALKDAGLKARLDDREHVKPGPKFFEWERKGVPVRLELGPRDLAENKVVLVRRDDGTKAPVPVEGLVQTITGVLGEVQQTLYDRALRFRDEHTHQASSLKDFERLLEEPGGFVEACTDGTDETERRIKERTKATIRIVLGDGEDVGGKCILSGHTATRRALFAVAY